jgi:hypothetical protein
MMPLEVTERGEAPLPETTGPAGVVALRAARDGDTVGRAGAAGCVAGEEEGSGDVMGSDPSELEDDLPSSSSAALDARTAVPLSA